MKRYSTFSKYAIVGKIQRNWIVTPSGSLIAGQVGGSLLHSFSGIRVWDGNVALIGKVDADFPLCDLDWLGEYGADIRGITRNKETFEMRSFINHSENEGVSTLDPIDYFSQKGLSYPRGLLGYSQPLQVFDSKTMRAPFSIRESEIPAEYLEATAVHIAPLDYVSHLALPAFFRNKGATTVTLDPAAGYMNPAFLRDLPILFKGVTALITAERKLLALFAGKGVDTWQIVDFIANLGVDIVVVKRGYKGQWLYDRQQKKRWEIPAYPVREYDPTGCGDSFCGGFLAGYRNTYSSLEACLYGNVSASICLESRSPRSLLEFIPRISRFRLDALREKVKML